MLDGMSDSIQGSRIENLQSREVDRQSSTGLIFILVLLVLFVTLHASEAAAQCIVVGPVCVFVGAFVCLLVCYHDDDCGDDLTAALHDL